MSTLNRDTDVLEKKRVALPDAEVPLRDQIVQKLFKKLEEDNVGQKICEIWSREIANKGLQLDRQKVFLDSWDNFAPQENAKGLFEGSSNLHLPIVFTAVKTFHARMFQALLGVDPPFSMKARREDSIPATEMVEQLMGYTIKEWVNEYRGCEDVVDAWLWDWITTGVGILKTGWETKYEKFIDVVKVPYQGTELAQDQEGRTIAIPVTKYREREKVVTVVKCKAPTLENIKYEDFVAIGGISDNPDTADVVIHRSPLTASELHMHSDQKLFDSEAVEKVIQYGKTYKSSATGADLKVIRGTNAGLGTIDTESEQDRYEILETHASLDVDGNGINSEVVMWIHSGTGTLLRATYLRRVNKSGERPYAVIHFHNRADGSGMGLPEIMHPIAQEIDLHHNVRADYGILSNLPYFFYKPSTNIDAVREELAPGKGIPLDNPQTDVYFPPMSNRTAYGFQEEQNLQTHLQRLTGLSDMSMGMMTGDQGATRTATGARALVGEANANLDIHLRRLNRGWGRVLQLLLHLVQQRMPDGFEFRVTGMDGGDYFARIKSKDDIQGDWDFEISPNTANSNKAITQQTAANIYQLTSNPIDYQLGIVTPSNRFEAIKNQLQSMGVKDWNRFVQKPQQKAQMTPEGELMAVLNGQTVLIDLQSDHQGFIDYWEYIKSKPQLLGQFNQDASVAVEKHALKHKEMLQAVQQMQAQQANVMQAQQNAQMSEAQTAPPVSGNVGPQ